MFGSVKTKPRWRGSLLLVVLAALLSPPVLAQDFADKVKAAFLYNFARFVTWPDEQFSSASEPLQICVMSDPGFGKVLAASVAGKSSGARMLNARDVETEAELPGCHAVFLSAESGKALDPQLLQRLAKAGVMTVHEDDQPHPGGVIRFYMDQRRVRFEVNRLAAEQAGLKISSKLLSVARLVES